MCRQERFFPDANLFLPERWLPDWPHPAPGYNFKYFGIFDPIEYYNNKINLSQTHSWFFPLATDLEAALVGSSPKIPCSCWSSTFLPDSGFVQFCLFINFQVRGWFNPFFAGCSGTATSWIVCLNWSTGLILILSFWLRNGMTRIYNNWDIIFAIKVLKLQHKWGESDAMTS